MLRVFGDIGFRPISNPRKFSYMNRFVNLLRIIKKEKKEEERES